MPPPIELILASRVSIKRLSIGAEKCVPARHNATTRAQSSASVCPINFSAFSVSVSSVELSASSWAATGTTAIVEKNKNVKAKIENQR